LKPQRRYMKNTSVFIGRVLSKAIVLSIAADGR
jgi:hypothetical protein